MAGLTVAEVRFWAEVIGRSPEDAGTVDLATARSLMRAMKLVDRLEREAAKAPLTVATAGGREVAHPALRALAGAHRRVEKLRASLGVAPQADTQRLARASAADAARKAMRRHLQDSFVRDDPDELLGWPETEGEWARLVEHNLGRARAGELPEYTGPR